MWSCTDIVDKRSPLTGDIQLFIRNHKTCNMTTISVYFRQQPLLRRWYYQRLCMHVLVEWVWAFKLPPVHPSFVDKELNGRTDAFSKHTLTSMTVMSKRVAED